MQDSSSKVRLSRRNVVLAAIGAAPVVALTSTGAQAKMAQTAVGYQQSPKDGKQCDGCNYFLPPDACKVVDGQIIPTGYCKLWNKKPTG